MFGVPRLRGPVRVFAPTVPRLAGRNPNGGQVKMRRGFAVRLLNGFLNPGAELAPGATDRLVRLRLGRWSFGRHDVGAGGHFWRRRRFNRAGGGRTRRFSNGIGCRFASHQRQGGDQCQDGVFDFHIIPNDCFERVCLVISVLLVSRSSSGPTALRQWAKVWNASTTHLARFMPRNQNLQNGPILDRSASETA